MSQARLSITDLKKSFGGRTVVSVDRLEIGRHRIEGLIGPNGAGKTTLMGLITRKLTADAGRLIYRPGDTDIDLGSMSMDMVARAGLVKTNQVIQDFESLSIRDSLRLSLALPEWERFWTVFARRRNDERIEAEIDEILTHFPFANPGGKALSAGEKKLLDIIRCLLLRPRVLLMDEPTAGLPDDLTRAVMTLVEQKADENDMSVFIIEHDLDLIWDYCAHVHFLAEGQLLCDGSPKEVRDHPVVVEKYMGIVDA
ncbi:ABC transporter ATP-binding protein [Chelativorans sp. M5D2P16]|uniref:ABC transporter ATP-binding protein n=1 Tax=Chelativorans sp. M5D2P16 TaxID=3095678 RepID=UPI002ACAA0CD|nr:ATP-binding cassette domain-containing protein [Chelativorans sp. M5D2P16]MDZ5697449.1 ATP-binding cassette domain-containing protein [Chelativorans sp. M5D2P16]